MDTPSRPIRRSYRPTLTGALYVLTALLLAIGAINGQNNLLFWAFGLAVAGLLVSGVISGASLMGVRAARRADPRAVVGGFIELSYELFNHNRLLPCVGVNLTESPSRAKGLPAPGTPTLGTPRVANPADAFATIVSVGARQSATVRARIPALARGRLELGDFEAWSLFPFGVMRKSVRFHTQARVLVRPRPLLIPRETFESVLHEGHGLTSARQAVAGVRGGEDYFSLREYARGDAARDIAWKRSAIAEAPLVKVYMPRRTSRVWLSLSLPGSTPEESEKIISAAAGLIELAAERRIEIGLWAPGARSDGRDVMIRPALGSVAYGLVLDALAELAPPDRPAAHPIPAGAGDRVIIVHAGVGAAGAGPGIDAREHPFAEGGV